MKALKNLFDHFNNAELKIAPNMKLKTISGNFMDKFDLALVFYKGSMIADPSMTLNQLDKKTTKKVKINSEPLNLKGSMKVGLAQKLFDEHFGVKVIIKDKDATRSVPATVTIGQASRGEY